MQEHCDVPYKKKHVAQARWLSWLERHPIHQKVVGSIPGWDAYGRQPINVSLSLPLPKINEKKREKKKHISFV